MELILKKDVENLGFVDDIVQVKNGYGRNFLIPNGDAVLATVSAKKVLAENLKQRAHKEQKFVDDAQKEADKLNALEVKITAKTGDGDKLFGSVNNADVAEYLTKAGVSIDKKFISIAGNVVKRLGNYEAKVRFHKNVIATLPFDVVADAK